MPKTGNTKMRVAIGVLSSTTIVVGTCQSIPFAQYVPFSLKLITDSKTYKFWCAPYLHYQVFVLTLGWLFNTVLVIADFIFVMFPRPSSIKMVLFSMLFASILLSFGVYDIIHWKSIDSFCKEIVPTLHYDSAVKNISCNSNLYLSLGILELVVSALCFVNHTVLGIFWHFFKSKPVFDMLNQ
ncbi:hypothetical protein EIN_187190 [Entamoeba invadens IP1]|uniref:hypothetical protein n=1 Tax=Entamoeba invadens IP1 TaxID=370355 RepID=UPI0002C3CED0|nr:hypothetical protein EIN_187190 [Entamoeba invadens IP1]ELP94262.1 hypothetical protein EIN_187190 [Entamoeba invadens IP1]|eukprot:XP_004261033.1 hypothetical protein EIN_187190 [Entamoeba invadens IP1]